MMIRARDKRHLELLVERFSQLRGYPIVDSPANDYRCRMFVPKKVWKQVMSGLVEEQDYDNFKGSIPKEMQDYHDVCMRVWSAMYRFQTDKYGPGIYSRPHRNVDQMRLFDEEESPFSGGEERTVVIGDQPDDEEEVLQVLDQDTGDTVGVVWWPDEYDSDEHAYSDAVISDALRVVAHPEFLRRPWLELKDAAHPIFDPYTTEPVDGAVSTEEEVPDGEGR
jgi:hypothetical protein